MSISIEEQIKFLTEFLDERWENYISTELEHFEAIKQTLEGEKKRRDTNVLLNGGRRER
jgi:hypothetical protein